MKSGYATVVAMSAAWAIGLATLSACVAVGPSVPPATDLAALRADAQLDNAVLTTQRAYDAVSPSLSPATRASALALLSNAVTARKAADAAYRLADGTFGVKAQAVNDLLAQVHALIGK